MMMKNKDTKKKDDGLSFLQKWTMNVNSMNLDVLNWAQGMEVVDNGELTFWQEYKPKIYLLVVLGLATGLFKLLGWMLMFRISGLMMILIVVGFVIQKLWDLFQKPS